MPKIAHTADIHIRALSRHDEYRQVLGFFIEDCKSQGVDHIFVGGDIFHTKTTGISPEYIDLLTWWLSGMANVAQVHLVLGNHDGNLVNLSRQDAVSPIVEAMANPKVHLYKKSGVYQIEPGYNFCVFSCFDEESWSSVKPIPGEVNIATFHGPVRGSKTETGWDIDDGVTVDFFDGYDFCLLGDIHKPQTLGYRNSKPWIAYPGTPIQQNYAEQLEHGYLLWNIKDSSEWDVVTRRLPNPKPYVTLDWSGSTEETLTAANRFPKGTRFRIKSELQIPQADVHVLSESLKTSMVATEVAYKSEFQFDKQAVTTGSSTVMKDDIRSSDSILKFLKEYHKDAKFSESEVSGLNELVKSYLKNVKSVDEGRGVKWSLRHLKWDNLFSYGEDNQVNFDKLNGIVGVFGPNRTGKSSMVGTLMYALFNTTDRGSMKNINICNVRKNHCSARVVVDHGGTTYVVERQTVKTANKKGVVSAPTSLNLFRMKEDGEVEDLCGEQRIDTDKVLKSLFGLPEDFLMTSLSAQGEINQFIDQGSTKRRALLAKFLDLDIFDKLHESASKEVSGYKSQLKNFPDRDWSGDAIKNEQLLKAYSSEIEELKHSIEEEQASIAILKSELSKHNASPVTQSDVDRQTKKVKDVKESIESNEHRINEVQASITLYQSKIESLDRLIEGLDVEDLKSKLEAQRSLESSLLELRHLYEKERTALEGQKKSIKILKEVPCGDEYPTCKFIKDAHNIKRTIDTQESRTEKALKNLSQAQASYDKVKISDLQDKIEKYEKANALASKMALEISKNETELERLLATNENLKTALVDGDKKLDQLKDALNNQENAEVVSIREKIKELSESIRTLDTQKLEVASKRGKLQSDIEKLESDRTKREELLRSTKLHDLIAGAFSKKGIPLLITKSQLPLINGEVSKILQGIVDFTIELENDEGTDSLEIYINYGDSRRMIELCSGMEKTMASLALRVAMINVSSLPKPDFFIIDEGFGTLDSAGVEACNRLLVSFKRYFKSIVVITHVDGIKDCADCILEIIKNEKDSRMEYT